MSNDLVLVTGGTGFLGTQVILAFIEKGFRVRATARSDAKISEWNAKYPHTKSLLEWAIVKDIITPGAFDESIKGVTILAHTASPFHFNVKDNWNDMLLPAIQGTREALTAAKKTPSVKRVVVTSSFASMINLLAPEGGKGIVYDDNTWNPVTKEQAIASDSGAFVYMASKKLAEEEAWIIAKEPDTKFSLTTLCPPYIFGPPPEVLKSLDSLGTSVGMIWALVDAKECKPNSGGPWVDVRDVAKAHVLAVTEDVAKGQRYHLSAGVFDDSTIADAIIRGVPEQAHRIPKAPVNPTPCAFTLDNRKVQRELGIKFIDFDTSVADTAKCLFEFERSLKA
ncbi:hypothetical protein P7C70_g7728, partial [Phenoliferia sp. Uapishka_3]